MPAPELSLVATYWLFWLHMRVAGALTYVHVQFPCAQQRSTAALALSVRCLVQGPVSDASI